jgi:hypothetical protein
VKPALSIKRTKVLPTHWQNVSQDENSWIEILALLQIIQVHEPFIHNSPDGHVYISAAPAILDTSSVLVCNQAVVFLAPSSDIPFFSAVGHMIRYPNMLATVSLLITMVKYSVLQTRILQQ